MNMNDFVITTICLGNFDIWYLNVIKKYLIWNYYSITFDLNYEIDVFHYIIYYIKQKYV